MEIRRDSEKNSMFTIERKSMLYKTGVEYGDYTMNHIFGCSHGCKFPCYAFNMAKRFGNVKEYKDWINPKLVSNTLELLEKEIPKYKNDIKSVHLCFSTDPFMVGYPEIEKISIDSIKLLNDNKIKCTVLTKGVLPKELSKLSKKNEYGITLVSLDNSFRLKYEPYSSDYLERIKALKYLHNKGCKTWISIEPYPTPNIVDQDLKIILNKINFVDKIIFGRLHYNKLVSEYKDYQKFYNEQTKLVIDFCKKNNIKYHIKKGTYKE